MKKITNYLVALAMLCFAGVANAQEDEVFDFDASFYHSWDEVSGTATDNGEAGGGVVIGEEVAIGGTIWGNLTGTVPYLNYANITEYSELRFEGTPGATIRLMCNRVTDEGPIYEIKPTFDEDGKLTVLISDLKFLNGGTPCDFVCLQSIKVPASWAGGTMAATITSIKIVKPGDPLSLPKTSLKNAINDGKKVSAVGKTDGSFGTLTSAISDGELELTKDDATKESLEAAAKAITDAIAGLELKEGYTYLTADMFLKYESVETPGEGSSTGCSYEIGKKSTLPYGDGSVGELNWADLTEYDKLIVVTSGDIKPRFCMNRLEAEGQQAPTKEESKMLDINPNDPEGKGTWSTEKYQTIEGNVFTIDLKAIVADYTFARLHSIKNNGGDGVIITDLLLYKGDEVVYAKVGATGYATFSSTKNVSIPEGLTAYKASVKTTYAELTEVKQVPAGQGVILKGEAKIYELPVIESATEITGNDLKVSKGDVEGDGSTIYVLADGTNGVGFYLMADEKFVPAGKAYLEVANSDAREFISFETNTTGIESVSTMKANDAVYNLAGQRVQKVQKGLFIINGKKVIR